MSNKIFEEIGGPRRGHAAGDTDVEKQASQLASDTKYKVKERLGKQTNLNPAQIAKAYIQQLAKSPAPPAVKALAKKKLSGSSSGAPSSPATTKAEEYEFDISESVQKTLVNALRTVFVEETEKKDRVWIVVTDKKTGNTYRRSLNPETSRAKIAELRANPNISSVEITKYHGSEDDAQAQGKKTARVKSGKGLADKDYDKDGKIESPKDEVWGSRARAAAKAGKPFKEEFIGEVKKEKEGDKKITGEGVNNYKGGKNSVVKVFPDEVKEQLNDKELPNQQNVKKPSAVDPNQRRQLSTLQQFQNKERQLNQQKLAAQKQGKIPVGSVQMDSYEPDGEDVQEVAPPGMEGTVKAMKKYPELSKGKTPEGKEKNIYALAWWMKGKGYKSHKTKSGADKEVQKSHYEPEGQVIGEEESPKLKKSEAGAEDPREIPTKVNLVRNKLRAMGLKMSYEPEGEVIDEAEKRIRQPRQSANPRGTYDSTGIGQYPRTGKERKKMRKGEPVEKYPELKRNKNNSEDDGDYRTHSSLSARERNPRLR